MMAMTIEYTVSSRVSSAACEMRWSKMYLLKFSQP